MTTPSPADGAALSLFGLLDVVRSRMDASSRVLLGLAGPPGSGKSTMADFLGAELGAVVAPMDGFHRTNDELERLGLRDRKGAPETFDADAFVRRVREVADAAHDVAWPRFDRIADEPVDDGFAVPADAPLVIVEGNYLLLDDAPWNAVPPLLDDVVFTTLDAQIRIDRLIDRHVAFGRSRAAAVEFVMRSDERNTALVEASRDRATLVVAVP